VRYSEESLQSEMNGIKALSRDIDYFGNLNINSAKFSDENRH